MSILSIKYFSLLSVFLRMILFEPDYLVLQFGREFTVYRVITVSENKTVIFVKRSISKINKMSTLRISSI